jgi:hypothetical protein
MNRSDIEKILGKVTEDIEAIADERVRAIQKTLLNLIEALLNDNDELRAENQRLRDEINRLKGEQGKPAIRKQTQQDNQDISSEKERRKKKKKKKRLKKKHLIKVNRTVICTIDKEQLPADAIFKGHQSVIVQDIIIQPDNIEFKKELYYSPSLKKTFMASLPAGYQGEFGPHIHQLVISLSHEWKMTESSIAGFLRNHGTFIGNGTISRFLTNPSHEFHKEKNDIVAMGLQSTRYSQMDDTSARVKGKNNYVHVLCNEYYTAYFTRPHKDRLTIIDILTQGKMAFSFSEHAFLLMQEMKLPEKHLAAMKANYAGLCLNKNDMDALINTLFPNPNKQQTNRQIILESTAIAAYQALPDAVEFLLTDDAPQYNRIAAYHPLCWVHDGRHYKKLMPVIRLHRKKLDEFITAYWDYYDQLLTYKASPTQAEVDRLSIEFDRIFSIKTDYEHLDERIGKTKKNKNQLLLVLEHPFLPLHNNTSELGARDQGRRRDISFHTMSADGTESKDTFMTLAQTAKKLAVNFYHYVGDRIKKKYEVPSLASLISEKSKIIVPDTC